MSVQKIKAGRVPGTDADNFVGDIGTLFYNEGVGDLRIGDGVTVGGIPLSFGSGDGGSYVLPTASTTQKGGVKIDNSTIGITNQVISVLNGVYTTGSYNNPDWITGLAYSKLSGTPTIPTNTSQLTNGAGFITTSALSGYATESYVTGRGYITSSALTGYATEAYVTGRGYITSSALSGYATELFVNNKFGNLTITGNTIDSTDSSAISFTPSVIFDSNVTLGGDLLPNADLGGNLGSITQQWKSLYVSGSTIYVGGVPLTITNNVLTVNGQPISATVNYGDVVGAPTDISQLTDNTGLLNAATGTGKSAYQVAVDNGFVGTESQWLASLVGATGAAGTNGTDGADGAPGAKGDPGDPGPAGADGADGTNGASAYEVAVTNGFTGTELEWLASLVGATGATGPAGANGTNGTNGIDGTNGTNGADGQDGDSAYQIAVTNGFVGTESQWLASLVGATGAAGTNGTNGTDGADGADGDSAYQVAVTNGFVGTESQWLASLVGATGATGPAGAKGDKGDKGDTGEISLANISVTTATAYNGSSLSYNNTTGVFTFTPPDLSVYALSTSVPTDLSDLTDNTGLLTNGASVTVATSAPTGSEQGDLWWDSVSGNMYVQYDSTWVSASNLTSITDYNQLTGLPDLTVYQLTADAPTALSEFTNDAGYIKFNANGTFSLNILTAPPDNPQAGQMALANGTTWDPAEKSSNSLYMVLYTGSSWIELGAGGTGSGVTLDQVYQAIMEIG